MFHSIIRTVIGTAAAIAILASCGCGDMTADPDASSDRVEDKDSGNTSK